MVRLTLLLWCSAGFISAQIAPNDAPTAASIIRRSVDRDWNNFSRARDYTFEQRVENRQLDRSGAVKSTESKTFDVVMIGERRYRKLIEENDRPLSQNKARQVQEAFDKEIRQQANLSAGERRKQADRRRKAQEESRGFTRQIPEAFDFELLRRDQLDGIPVWVIRAEPRQRFKPKAKDARLLNKFRAVLWIDEKEYQWVRIEAEVIDTVSFGWVLARLGKGTALTFQQTRVHGEIWMPSRAQTRVNARLALLKPIRAEVDVRWRNYRKFSTESRVVSLEDASSDPDR